MLRELFLLTPALVLTLAHLLIAGVSGVRFEFKTFYDSMPLLDSEICFLPRSFDRERVEGILAAREVKCLPAHTVLAMPRGSWYFFAQNPAGLVSPHRSELTLGSNTPADLFKAVRLDLVEAATLNLAPLRLGPEEFLFAWGPETASHQAPVFMRDASAATMLVPANVSVIPVISRRGQPVWIGKPIVAAPKKPVPLERAEPAEGTVNVLASVAYVMRSNETPPPPPRVVLEIDGKQYASTDLGPVRFGGFAVVAFYGVPRRPGVLRLDGTGWQAPTIPFEPGSRAHLLIEQPLRATPSAPPKKQP